MCLFYIKKNILGTYTLSNMTLFEGRQAFMTCFLNGSASIKTKLEINHSVNLFDILPVLQ